MRKWIKETDDPEYKYIRELLRDYVLILANSGMRVGEANNLKESDVELFVDELGRKNYMLRVKGKTGTRIVIPRTGALRYINRVFERNKARRTEEELSPRTTRSPKRKVDSKGGDWFFSMYDGSKIITLTLANSTHYRVRKQRIRSKVAWRSTVRKRKRVELHGDV